MKPALKNLNFAKEDTYEEEEACKKDWDFCKPTVPNCCNKNKNGDKLLCKDYSITTDSGVYVEWKHSCCTGDDCCKQYDDDNDNFYIYNSKYSSDNQNG